MVPAGSYQWTRYRAEANTATKRPWVVDAAWWWGGFYGGTLRQLELGVTVKPNTYVAISVQAERNDVTLAGGTVLHGDSDHPGRLQLHPQCLVGQPDAVR